MAFFLFVGFIIFQRLTELTIAKKNEISMKQKGALEFGANHYPWMVSIHTAFIASFITEYLLLNRELSIYWPILITLFILTQFMRVWALRSLGPYWNTKVIVLPGAEVVQMGPYRFIKHPNYVVVALEVMIIPLMFNAWITAIVFTLLNFIILSIRIRVEESALSQLTLYQEKFQ